ncbi:6176_t:CDS:2, partial [Cetraspora pellucida]
VVEEVTGTPGKQKDSKLPDWIDDNLKSLVYELGLENKVKEIEKKIAKEDLLEVLQDALLKRNSLLQEANLAEGTQVPLVKVNLQVLVG